MYLIDEPERHLHPRLQRQAANWLWRTLADRDAQALFATHSMAFLDLGEGTRYVHMTRSAQEVAAHPIDPDAMHASDDVARELGFDRGELLTNVRMLLFVEGLSDEVVLKVLYGPDLRRAGALVVPIHVVMKLKGITEAEALLRITTATIAVLVDGDTAGRIAGLADDPEHLASVLRAKGNNELSAVARLIDAARRQRLEVQPYGIRPPDIFGSPRLLGVREPLRFRGSAC